MSTTSPSTRTLVRSLGTAAGAVSVSGLTYRTPLSTLVDAVDEIRSALGPLTEASPRSA